MSRRTAVVFLVVLFFLVVAAVAWPKPPAQQMWQYNYKKWLPAVWQRIAKCETGLNWTHNSGTYQGAFGFHHQSWDGFAPDRYPSEAYLATPWQQYQVALRIYNRYGFTGWGCYTHRAWVRG